MSEDHPTHQHPNYTGVWAVLVLLLVVGIAVGFVGHPVLATVLVFLVASLKATLVAANFMHLRNEPFLVRLIVFFGLGCVLTVLIGLIPDIVYGKPS